MTETYTLDVSGNTNLKGNVYCYFDSTQNKSLYINDNFYINTVNGNTLKYFSPDQHVFLDTSNNELFRTMISYTATYNKHIFNNNVGIGTYDPSGALHVTGGNSIFNNNVGIGTLDPSYNLQVVGTTVLNGSTTITNNTTPSFTSGTLILKKTASNGVSSIVFPSNRTDNTDYSSIEYYDDVYGTNLNYFGTLSSEEQGSLFINCQNDGNDVSRLLQDNIVIRPVANLILDAGKYSVDASGSIVQDSSGAIFMAPNSGNVGIGTLTPSSKLHVIGNTIIDGDVSISGIISNTYQTNTILSIKPEPSYQLSLPLPSVIILDAGVPQPTSSGSPPDVNTRFIYLPIITTLQDRMQLTIRRSTVFVNVIIYCDVSNSMYRSGSDSTAVSTITLNATSCVLIAYNSSWYEI